MTTVGHSLMGMSIGVLCMGRFRSWGRRAAFLAVFIFLANIPDIRLPYWGHNAYRVSHSLLVNLALIGLLVVIFGVWSGSRRAIGGWGIIACGTAAWLSHLLLDSFYNHGLGIAIFWPVSRARLVLPLPWFNVLRGGWAMDLYTLKIVIVEALFYGGVLIICLTARSFFIKRAPLRKEIR